MTKCIAARSLVLAAVGLIFTLHLALAVQSPGRPVAGGGGWVCDLQEYAEVNHSH